MRVKPFSSCITRKNMEYTECQKTNTNRLHFGKVVAMMYLAQVIVILTSSQENSY